MNVDNLRRIQALARELRDQDVKRQHEQMCDGLRFQTVYALLFAADRGDNVARNILIQTKLMAEPGKQSKNMRELRERCDAAIALVDSMGWNDEPNNPA